MIVPTLRLVFFGTPAFAVPTLDALLASRHTVVGVVTQPDRPRGRGQKASDAPVKQRAITAGVPLLQPTTLKPPAFIEELAALRADLGVVAAYGRILSEQVLAIPPLGMINVHASLLPKYRGAAPVHRAVIAGETETGVTIMRVVRALDAGPMLATVRLPIDPEATSAEVERALAVSGAALLVDTVDRLAEGAIQERPQDDAAATYAARLTKEDGRIDWHGPATRVHNLVRGLHPWPLAYSFLNGARLIIRRTRVAADFAAAAVPPGTIVAAGKDGITVATADAAVALVEVQAEGSRPMSARDYVAGHRVTEGMRFSPAP